MLEIKLGPLFQGQVCPKYSELEAKDPAKLEAKDIVPVLHNSSNEWASNLFLQKNLRTYTLW